MLHAKKLHVSMLRKAHKLRGVTRSLKIRQLYSHEDAYAKKPNGHKYIFFTTKPGFLPCR